MRSFVLPGNPPPHPHASSCPVSDLPERMGVMSPQAGAGPVDAASGEVTGVGEQAAVLDEFLRDSILPETIVPFGEAAWFAWRRDEMRPHIDIRNGVWWREDGSRVLSLGMGSGLHYHRGIDWETYAFKGAADGFADDVCCHDTEAEAERCALTFLLAGRFCSEQSTPIQESPAARRAE